MGEEGRVYRNNKINLDEVKKLNPEMIVISLGPKTLDREGLSVEIIEKFYKTRPIFGICLGYQSLIQVLGGRIYKGKNTSSWKGKRDKTRWSRR